MHAAAIVLSYGRPELGELLAMWARQSIPIKLLVWLDDCPVEVTSPSPLVHVHRSPRLGNRHGIGGVRAAAVALARELWGIDSFLVLDDDDYYSPHHAELTLRALEVSPHGWTGGLRVGIQWGPDGPIELVRGGSGPGQHATWALSIATYDAAGGYLEADHFEDIGLGRRIQQLPAGPREYGNERCGSHGYVTHVRRQFGTGFSVSYDRTAVRRVVSRVPIVPVWRPELDELAKWCAQFQSDFRGIDGSR